MDQALKSMHVLPKSYDLNAKLRSVKINIICLVCAFLSWENRLCMEWRIVVSIGVDHTFKIVFTPLEYIPSIPPLPSGIIKICLYLAKILRFFGSRFYKP